MSEKVAVGDSIELSLVESSLATRDKLGKDGDVDLHFNWSHYRDWDSSKLFIACCCPCILIGNMHTMVARENERNFHCFTNYDMGSKGMGVCLKYACISSICWPCPIGVSCYLLKQQRDLRIAYNLRVAESATCNDTLSACCLWPCILLQQFDFFKKKEVDKLIFFEWETKQDINRDRSRMAPPTKTIRAVILGPSRSGKSQFAHKLLNAANSHTANNSNSLQVGYRPLAVTESSVDFLEVWDCPSYNISRTELASIIASSDYVALVYDIMDTCSFEATKQIYTNLQNDGSIVEKTVVCFAMKLDGVWNMRALYNSLDSSVQFERDRLHQELLAIARQASEAREWAREHSIQYVEVSSQANYNILAATKCFSSYRDKSC